MKPSPVGCGYKTGYSGERKVAAAGAGDTVNRGDASCSINTASGVRAIPSATDLFPCTSAARAEILAQQVRELLDIPVHRSPAASLWDAQMLRRDKRFLCRLADVQLSCAAYIWYELPTDDQAKLIGAFLRLRSWVGRFSL